MYPHSLNSCSMPELPEHLWASCSLSNKHLQPGGHNEKRRGKKGQRDDNFLLGECCLKETVFCLAKGAQIYKINMNIQIFVYSPSRHRALCSSQSVLFSQGLLTADPRGREGSFFFMSRWRLKNTSLDIYKMWWLSSHLL